MANQEHLAILKQGVRVWNEWRDHNIDILPDLSGAELINANLTRVNLRKADLRGVNFTGADLSEARLRSAQLRGAKLTRVDLTGARLISTDLSWVDLTEATLINTYLIQAILIESKLGGANFNNATVGVTTFASLDLSVAKRLETVQHTAPSIIGVDTIYFSKGEIPEIFLRGCGVPEDMIAYTRSLRGKAIDFCSCFISHSAKDKRFCERLYADLQAKGVRAWYFPEDAKWGETVWGEIDRSIKVYDKLVVVCSENSLQSSPVNREIERALNREDKESKGILFPIRIDDYVFDTWEHERKADVLAKVVGDFSGWDRDAAKYAKAFDKLLKGLQSA